MKSCFPIILAAATSIAGCNHDTHTVVFTLPDGYNGLVLLSEDKTGGVELPFSNGTYHVEVPRTGKLALRSMKPFVRWHKEIARYQSGKHISDETTTNRTE